MSQWYYARGGQTFGPFSSRQLRDMARGGQLRADDLVSQPGAPKWHTAGTVRGLFSGSSEEFGPDDPPPPPPPVAVQPAARAIPAQASPPWYSTAPQVRESTVAAEPGMARAHPLIPKLLALPKPILFGLFGMVGGLLGAVLLAELLWWLLRPAAADQTPRLQVAVPEVVRTYVGGRNTFLVKIARQGFTGPVKVEASGTSDITVPAVSIPSDVDEAKVEVQTPDGTRVDKYPLEVRVTATESKSIEPVKEKVTLSVEPMPPTLAVAVSPEVVVEQGGRGRFTVRIARDRFDDNVALEFQGAPAGVTFRPSVVIREGRRDETVDLSATATAPLTSVPVTVQAVADVGGKPVKTDAVFNLVVKERSPPAVDVVFVLDLTGSMDFAIEGIKRGIQSFTEELEKKRLDARIGVVCFRDIDPPPAGDNERPYPLYFARPDGGTETFTRDYRAVRDRVAPLWAGGGGDEPESSLQGLAVAAKQPFRSNASRVLILITDAQPKIHPREMPSTIPQAIEELKKHEIDQVHLVVRPKHLKSDWQQFKDVFKGEFKSIEDVSTGDAFAELLPVLSRAISRITITSAPRGATRASAPPPLPEARSDAPPPATAIPTLKAVQSDQAFAAKDSGRLFIALMVWTSVVAGAISLLLLAGQQFHARQSWVGLGEGGWAVLGGVVAGLVGGGIGQLVFQSTASPAASWEWVSRILGWSFLGSLIGGLLAFFVPNLKWYRGMLGGLAGGIFGAVAFLLVTLLMGSLLGRWLGAAILGFCLGLMVALAELAFRRFWLEIAVSPREVRTMTLGSTAISLGSDEKRASFFVAGAAPVALRLWVDGNEVCCEDASTGQTTLVAPGESHKVGRVTVTMRGVAASRRTGFELAADRRAVAPVAGRHAAYGRGPARPGAEGHRRHGGAGERAAQPAAGDTPAQSFAAELDRLGRGGEDADRRAGPRHRAGSGGGGGFWTGCGDYSEGGGEGEGEAVILTSSPDWLATRRAKTDITNRIRLMSVSVRQLAALPASKMRLGNPFWPAIPFWWSQG